MGAAVSGARARVWGPTLAAAFGVMLVGAVATGEYHRYLKPTMAIPLVLTGVFLLGVAFFELLPVVRRVPTEVATDPPASVDHGQHTPPVATMLLAPVVVLALLGPPALGSYASQRTAGPPPPPSGPFEPLPDGDPLGLPLSVYAERSLYGGEAGLEGRRFEMVGFVVPNDDGSWTLTRLKVACCAADNRPYRAFAVDAPEVESDTWVSVTGTHLPAEADLPRVRVEEVREVAEPDQPYLY